ncbi:MAG: histidine kinase dimerization/phosphoacceptor domain -containing protein [Methanolobus sp.]|nr:histidine kinase dimerization/phosphoacceptor domain -containing protein [Methanolobus sp.]
MTSLREKTLLIIGVTLIGLIIVLFMSSQVIIVNSFIHLEQEELKKDVQSARNSLYSEMQNLEKKTVDWAVWEESYDFVQIGNQGYIDNYLMDETFINQKINFVLFYNSSNELVYSKGIDISENTMISPPQSLIDHLGTNDYLLEHSSAESKKTGFLYFADAPMMVTSQPIIRTYGNDSIGGTIVMGRFLDKTEMSILSDVNYVTLDIRRVDGPEELQEEPDLQLDSGEYVYVDMENENVIYGSILLNDIYDDPVMVLDVSIPRSIYLHSKATMAYFVMILLLSGGVFAFVTRSLLENSFISRLNKLNDDIKHIGESQDFSRRIFEEGDDEISNLIVSMNSMLESLEQSEKLVSKRDATIKAIIQAMPDMVFQIRKDGTVCNYKLSTDECLYESPDMPLGIKIDDVLPRDIASKELKIIEEVLSTGKMQTMQYQLPVKGEIRDFEVRIVVSGEDEVMSVVKDITEMKQAEEARKKDVLLKEIHHRVKNNLQVISSLLRLQSRKFKDSEVIEAFRESQHRARSMAMAHENLYHSHDLENIDLEMYIPTLVKYLVSSYGFTPDNVTININIKNIIFGIDTSIPIGLIINELVSNSLKYAFPEGTGEIKVELYPENDKFILKISDDGIGFPENIDFRETDSLGLQLVNSLVEQIEGTIELDRNNGTEFKISFKELSYKRRDY